MKIAFATTDGINVDEHFGRAGMFAIYELTADGYKLIELRRFADGRDASNRGEQGNSRGYTTTWCRVKLLNSLTVKLYFSQR